MNRLVTTNLTRVSPETLPPKARLGSARVLFLSTQILGLKVFTSELESRTNFRDDIDAVHVRLVAPPTMNWLGKSFPPLRGYDFHSYRYLLMWGSRIGRWLRGPLHHQHFDAIHITTQNNALGILRLPKDCKSKIMLDIDATALQEARDFKYGMFDRRPIIKAERKMFARADLIACWSEWARRSVIDDYAVPEDRTCVTRVGVNIPRTSRSALAEKDRADRLPRIAFVGNDWGRKGGQRLVNWHQAHWKDRAELHIFSGRAERDESAKNIVWHGSMPRDELLSKLLPTMDVFVLPTREDTLALAAVEAQGVGVPVVVSKLSGIATDVVKDGETGILCEVGDDSAFISAVERLLGDPALRRRMSDAGRAFVASEWAPDDWYTRHLDRLVSLAKS